ncbi:hypothetical protein [Terribacillus saccharophilus]|uniref:hypothetical protein n=1 Tax=Terribacillus saccharophilus TaxID=361277 RepID=UPI0015CF5395|nr:hypothetical protein [Terribacillus saccharophilus]
MEELKVKLLEEANEILKVKEHNEVVEEAADLLSTACAAWSKGNITRRYRRRA